MTTERRTRVFALACALSGAAFYLSFFWNFQKTLSDWSGFGFSWTVQMFHNFVFGRPFQSSLFAGLGAGASVGFTHNPYAYIHANVIHVNLTPYIFALLWSLAPAPATIYFLIFAWNLAAGAWLSRSILRRLGSTDLDQRALFAVACLVGGGLLSVLCQMGQLLLFAGPFILAVFDAFLSRRKAYFLLAVLALALLSEDSTMVLGTLAAFLFLFEEDGRPWGLAAGLVAAGWIGLVLFKIQPTARAALTLTHSTTTAVVAGRVFALGARTLVANVSSMAPLLPSALAFPLAAAFFGVPDRKTLLRAAALGAAVALPHGIECVLVGGAHHLLPPFYAMHLALLVCLAGVPGRPAGGRAAAALAAAFFAAALRVNAGQLPVELKPALYRLAHKPAKAEAAALSLAGEEVSNRDVLSASRALPADASLVYLVNNHLTGFLSARSDVWEFPDQFDRADYVLVQKDAIDADYSFAPRPGEPLSATFASTPRANERGQRATAQMLDALKAGLVGPGVYSVSSEDDHVLLLKRNAPTPREIPPSTFGWNWFRAR
jgi:hypothetical protein